MKKFIAIIAGVIAMLSTSAQATTIQDCRHDVAPIEAGRYAADKKNGVVVSEEIIPVGSIVTMSYKVGSDMIGWVTCRTTKVRKHATVKDGQVYDIGCGNVVRKVEKAGTASKNDPVINLDIQQPVCDGKCQLEKVCASDSRGSGTLVSTDVGLVCKLPKLTMTFEQEVETFGKVTWKDKGWTGEKHEIPGPKLDAIVGKTDVSISKEMCYTQGCAYRPEANFVSEVRAQFCGIRTSDGRVFRLTKNPNTNNLQIYELKATHIKADMSVDAEAVQKDKPKQMNFSSEPMSKFKDCDAVQVAVEGRLWPAVTQFFSLPNSCTVARRVK